MHCVFGSFVVIGMGFDWFDSGFSLALPFPRYPWCDGIHFWLRFGLPEGFLIRVRWSQENPKVGDGDGFLQEAINRWVDTRKFIKG